MKKYLLDTSMKLTKKSFFRLVLLAGIGSLIPWVILLAIATGISAKPEEIISVNIGAMIQFSVIVGTRVCLCLWYRFGLTKSY